MLVQLTEMSQQAERLLRFVRKQAQNLLVYTYDQSLEELARKTGVALYDKRSDRNVAMAHLEGLQPRLGI